MPAWPGSGSPTHCPPTPARGTADLVDPQQEGDAEGAEDLLVEVGHGDEHLVLLVDVHLVQWDFLQRHEFIWGDVWDSHSTPRDQ